MLCRYISALFKHPFVRGSPFIFTTYRKLFYSEVDGEVVGAKMITDKTYKCDAFVSNRVTGKLTQNNSTKALGI